MVNPDKDFEKIIDSKISVILKKMLSNSNLNEITENYISQRENFVGKYIEKINIHHIEDVVYNQLGFDIMYKDSFRSGDGEKIYKDSPFGKLIEERIVAHTKNILNDEEFIKSLDKKLKIRILKTIKNYFFEIGEDLVISYITEVLHKRIEKSVNGTILKFLKKQNARISVGVEKEILSGEYDSDKGSKFSNALLNFNPPKKDNT